MALKPVVHSTKTDEVPLAVCGRTWFVRVRHITRAHDRELVEKAMVKKLDEQTRQQVDDFDQTLHSLLFCRAAVINCPIREDEGQRHWRGLTPDMLAMLVELPDGYTPKTYTEGVIDPATGEAHEVEFIDYDPELAEFLWTEARRELVQDPIVAHARAVLLTTQLRKEAERGNLPGSPAA